MKRSEILERRSSFTIVPGLRSAPSGLRVGAGRAGSRSHRRFRRDAILLRGTKLDMALAWLGRGSRRGNGFLFTSPRRAGRGRGAERRGWGGLSAIL